MKLIGRLAMPTGKLILLTEKVANVEFKNSVQGICSWMEKNTTSIAKSAVLKFLNEPELFY